MATNRPPQSLASGYPNNILAPRTLVLCFDGTANQFVDDRNTNVVHIFQMLRKDDPNRQLVYYQTGIGTYTPPGMIALLGSRISEMLDDAVAWYLEEHVLGGYRFLMETYRQGDKICFFGFSRGAYTARALAGMLFRVGLLPMNNYELVPFAYRVFKDSYKENGVMRADPTNPKGYLSRNFRSTFSREVTVEFVGIWDTVSSVGLFPRSLPNTAQNPIVQHVRHAMSLDERRAKFKSNPWSATIKWPGSILASGKDQRGIPLAERTVEEVWFAGGHGDVGGGWVPYKSPAALSHIPLRWMVREATANSSIVWDEEVLARFQIRQPTTRNELERYIRQEKADALSPFHSAFTWNNLWWILEVIPLIEYIHAFDRWFTGVCRPHGFRARKIRKPTEEHPTKVHSSVKTRLQLFRDGRGRKYRNAAQWDPKMTEFVDEWALPEGVE